MNKGLFAGFRWKVLVVGLVASACASSSDGPVERVAQQGSALTSASADILGFEVASSWTASQGTAALSNTHTQGLHSLSVAPRGYVTYTSARLSSLSGVSSKIAFDLEMPSAQANPSWFGAAQLYLSIPSRSVYNAYLGQVELTGLPLQNWNSLVYTIPDDLVAKLKTTYTDATFSIALNVPTNAKGSYLLDNMRFIGPDPEQVTVTFGDSPVNLRATKFYEPERREDGSATPSPAVLFTIPKTIPVLVGSSGNGQATLSYKTPSGANVTCSYNGGSSVAHPTTDLELAKGRSYDFQSCSNGAAAGSDATGTQFGLSVVNGDAQDPAKRTIVELSLGKTGCSGKLDPPISAADSVRIRDAFSWSQTRAVPEADAQGRPTLYYALIYLEDREQWQTLDQLLIHHSLLPIFDNELKRYDDQCGHFRFEGDGRGQFVYALLPGVTYNLIRQYALTPDPVEGDQSLFSVMKILDVPDVRARNADGSVSWEALMQVGFYYMNQRTFPADDTTEVHQNPFLNSLRRRVSKFVAKAARRTVRAVVEGLGVIDRWLAGSVNATTTVVVLNRDPRFDTTKSMQRAWGASAGQNIAPAGARFEILQWMQFGEVTTPFPTGYSGNLGEDGSVKLRVAKNRGLRGTCVATTNSALELTSLLTENLICSFGKVNYEGFTHDIGVTINTSDKELHVFTAITDARTYLNRVVKYPQNHRAEVLDGWIANRLGSLNGGAAFTPCFDFPNIGSDFQISVLNLYYGGSLLVDGLLSLVEPFTAVDMMLPDQAAGNFDSRGVGVHEYGHFSLCSFLYDRGFFNISIAYVDAAHQRTQNGSDPPPPDAQGAYINEAFADFIADQVVGGTDYVSPPHSSSSFTMSYCNSSGICMDTNGSSRSSFDEQITRIFTTLHDAFDGHGLKRSDQPGDGDFWSGPPFSLTNMAYGDAHDETIAVPGQCLPQVIDRWDDHGELLEDSSFLAGLADVMKDPACGNANWCQICHLFALHQGVTAGPPSEWQECTRAPVNGWIGAPPANTLNLNAATCQPCPAHQISTSGACVACPSGSIQSGGACQACASGTVPVDGQDACCPPGTTRTGGQCVALCGARQVFQGGVCVTCPESNVVQINQCVACPAATPYRYENQCVADCGVLLPNSHNVCVVG